MSATTIKPTITDQAVADAKSMPELISKLSILDPAIAQQFQGKALVASKTVWGQLIGMGVSWVVTKYGLGWDDQTSALVTGGIEMLLAIGFRYITTTPIGGVLKVSTPAVAKT